MLENKKKSFVIFIGILEQRERERERQRKFCLIWRDRKFKKHGPKKIFNGRPFHRIEWIQRLNFFLPEKLNVKAKNWTFCKSMREFNSIIWKKLWSSYSWPMKLYIIKIYANLHINKKNEGYIFSIVENYAYHSNELISIVNPLLPRMPK